MTQMVRELAKWLVRQDVIQEKDKEAYEYSIYCMLLTAAPLFLSVAVGMVMGDLKGSIILVLPFLIIRKFSGGFHAKHIYSCLTVSALLLAVCFYLALRIQNNVLLGSIVTAASFSLIIFSPIDSENRRLEPEEKNRRKKQTAILTIIFLIVYAVLSLYHADDYAVHIAVGIILAAGLQWPCFWPTKEKTRYETD